MNDSDLTALREKLARSPYSRMMGFELAFTDGKLTARLPYADQLIGNPLLSALHGGTVAALLHFTAAAQLMLELGTAAVPRAFTATNEFLASPRDPITYAAATLVTRSRRFANLRVTAWQKDASRPVAAASVQFIIG